MKMVTLKSKVARFTPAWIWRHGRHAKTLAGAALAEKDVFQQGKVIATGGSKRGVATAAAGIADDRFTGIMPIVAPVIDPPGGPYVEGMRPGRKSPRPTNSFRRMLKEGKLPNAPRPRPYEPLRVS